MSTPLSEAALDALRLFTVDPVDGLFRVYPCDRQLDPIVYAQCKELMVRLNGKWANARGYFVFEDDPTTLLQAAIEAGHMPDKNPMAFFPTPPAAIEEALAPVVDRIREHAAARRNGLADRPLRILEPSAGRGAFAKALRDIPGDHIIDTVELSDINQRVLRAQGFDPFCGDFLDYNTDHRIQYDIICMNPPFSSKTDKLLYMAHIQHAYGMLAHGGELVSIVPSGLTHRTDTRSSEFLDFVLTTYEDPPYELGAGAFKSSGTTINTYLLYLSNVSGLENPIQGHPNFFSFSFELLVDNNRDLAKHKATLFDYYSEAACEAFVDQAVEFGRRQFIRVPTSHRGDYITHVQAEYRQHCLENGLPFPGETKTVMPDPDLTEELELDLEYDTLFAMP